MANMHLKQKFSVFPNGSGISSVFRPANLPRDGEERGDRSGILVPLTTLVSAITNRKKITNVSHRQKTSEKSFVTIKKENEKT